MFYRRRFLFGAACVSAPSLVKAADVQTPGDRQDPSLAREQLKNEAPKPANGGAGPAIQSRPVSVPQLAEPITPGAIRVDGATVLPASAFAETIQPYLGRSLSARDLARLAGEVAAVLRRAGYGLATASDPAQKLENGVLRIQLDEGRIDEVDAGGDAAVERVLRVLANGDRLSIGGAATPLKPGEFQYAEATYAKALGGNGTEAAVSGYHAHTRTREQGGARRVYDGNSSQAEIRVTHALARSRAFSGWVTGDFALMDSALSLGGRPVRSDRIARASALLNLLVRGKSHWIRGRIGFVQGLDMFGATEAGDPLASRRDASGRFTKLEFYSAFGADLAPRVGLLLALQGQFASVPLLVSEEIGLGGQSFLRAFDYREVSGDEGAAASAELRYDLLRMPGPFRRGQLYLYADAGRVSNHQNGFGGGALASAGGGFRTWLRSGFEGSFEVGMPLTDSPFDPDPAPRFSFTLSKSFSAAQGK